MVQILTVQEIERWDDRRWAQALKGDSPEETFRKIQEDLELRLSVDIPKVDDLPPELQAWYRST